MKKLLLLFALLVIVSGCITAERKPTIDANNGIIIKEFTAEMLPAKAGDLVSFFVDLENVGGTTAKSVRVSLYGVENLWKDKEGRDITTTPVIEFPEMKPPSLATNRAGDFKVASWQLKPSENLPQGVTTNFPVTARVTFMYSSTSTISLPAYSETLYTAKKTRKEFIDSNPRVDNSFAPVQVMVTKATLPLVINDRRTGNEVATYVFEFADVGSGFPVTEDVVGRMKGRMELRGPGASFSDCLGATGGTVIDPIDIDLIKLRSDRRVPFGCAIKIDRSKWAATMSGNIIFSIAMEYRYYVESTVEVPVIGTKEPGPIVGPGCECTYTQACRGPNNCIGTQVCNGVYSNNVCVWDASGRCNPACTECACEGVTTTTTVPGGTTTTTTPGGCRESWTCLDGDTKKHVKTDCTVENLDCASGFSCFDYGSNFVKCEKVCLYDSGGKACAGTEPHCSGDADTVCETPSCGYNPYKFNYDPGSSTYGCSGGGYTVCEYGQGNLVCLGTNPRCDNNDCSQKTNVCGYNPIKFNYISGSANYACRTGS